MGNVDEPVGDLEVELSRQHALWQRPYALHPARRRNTENTFLLWRGEAALRLNAPIHHQHLRRVFVCPSHESECVLARGLLFRDAEGVQPECPARHQATSKRGNVGDLAGRKPDLRSAAKPIRPDMAN